MLCSDLLWDAQSVSRKQVPTLQDALLCCDRETLLSMVEQGMRVVCRGGVRQLRSSVASPANAWVALWKPCSTAR